MTVVPSGRFVVYGPSASVAVEGPVSPGTLVVIARLPDMTPDGVKVKVISFLKVAFIVSDCPTAGAVALQASLLSAVWLQPAQEKN